mgnify:CR=1 FL=1
MIGVLGKTPMDAIYDQDAVFSTDLGKIDRLQVVMFLYRDSY